MELLLEWSGGQKMRLTGEDARAVYAATNPGARSAWVTVTDRSRQVMLNVPRIERITVDR